MKIRKIKNLTNKSSLEAVTAKNSERDNNDITTDQIISKTVQDKKGTITTKKFRVLKAKILIEEDASEMKVKKITKNFKIKGITVGQSSNIVSIKDQKNDNDQILFQGFDESVKMKKTD
tara:strand:+ start:477 stop:833 length:357 start_codon:yes stop_codon:yes gene_type:complete